VHTVVYVRLAMEQTTCHLIWVLPPWRPCELETYMISICTLAMVLLAVGALCSSYGYFLCGLIMSPFIFAATTNPMQNPALSRHCLDVGRALKRVDRTTFLDWARWCEGVFSVNVAMVLWDSFAPVACDVHCASYSQVQLMLLINRTVAQAFCPRLASVNASVTCSWYLFSLCGNVRNVDLPCCFLV
jgi:hypothetical protein